MMESKSNNHRVSDEVHYSIPVKVRQIVNGHLLINERLRCQHNRTILDEIVDDLIVYSNSTDPTRVLKIWKPVMYSKDYELTRRCTKGLTLYAEVLPVDV